MHGKNRRAVVLFVYAEGITPDTGRGRSSCFGTRLAVSGEPEGYTGLGEILPSAGYMARLAVAVA